MAFLVYLFFIVFSQTVSGRISPYLGGQNAVDLSSQLPFPNTNTQTLGNTKQLIEAAREALTANRIPKNEAEAGKFLGNTAATKTNANIGSGKLANVIKDLAQADTNRISKIEKVNPSPKLNTKLGNINANSKVSKIKQPAHNLANNVASSSTQRTNILGNFPNLPHNGLGNHFHCDIGNQPYRSNFANPIPNNLANPFNGNVFNNYNAPNMFNPLNNINAGNQNLGLNNFAPNFGNGNIASGNIANFANALATGNVANAIMPGANFAIGGNPFTVLSGLPGNPNQQIGLNVIADALEIAGSVSVAGKMPFSGTVALNGILPTEGTGAVNYGCTHDIF